MMSRAEFAAWVGAAAALVGGGVRAGHVHTTMESYGNRLEVLEEKINGQRDSGDRGVVLTIVADDCPVGAEFLGRWSADIVFCRF